MAYRWRWPALMALLTAEAMNLLDSTIVTVAAPVIRDRLGGPAADIQWFTAAYTLPFSVLLILGGRAARRHREPADRVRDRRGRLRADVGGVRVRAVGRGAHRGPGGAGCDRGGLVETSVFANPGFSAALLTSVLFFSVTTGLTLVVVLHLQLGLHLDVLPSALSLLPWSAAMAVASLVCGGWLVPRYGARVMYPGLAVLLIATILGGAGYAIGADRALLLADLALLGVGQGLFAVPFFTAALHRVRPAETGSAAGMLNAVQQLGATLGTAVLGSVFLHAGAFTGGARDAFGLAAIVLLAAGVTTHVMVTDGRRRVVGPLRRTKRKPAPAESGSGPRSL